MTTHTTSPSPGAGTERRGRRDRRARRLARADPAAAIRRRDRGAVRPCGAARPDRARPDGVRRHPGPRLATGQSGKLGYEISLCYERDGDALRDRVLAAGEPFGILVTGPSDINRVEARIFTHRPDMDDDFIGKATLTPIRDKGVKERLVGIEILGEPPATPSRPAGRSPPTEPRSAPSPSRCTRPGSRGTSGTRGSASSTQRRERGSTSTRPRTRAGRRDGAPLSSRAAPVPPTAAYETRGAASSGVGSGRRRHTPPGRTTIATMMQAITA